jgi:hypothetical protein
MQGATSEPDTSDAPYPAISAPNFGIAPFSVCYSRLSGLGKFSVWPRNTDLVNQPHS